MNDYRIVEIKLFDYVVLEKLKMFYNKGEKEIIWGNFIHTTLLEPSNRVAKAIHVLRNKGVIKAKLIKEPNNSVKKLIIEEIRDHNVVTITPKGVRLLVEKSKTKRKE